MSMFEIPMSERLKTVIYSFLEACERFWDNRFRRDETSEEVLYLRRELDKARQDLIELARSFANRDVASESDTISDSELKPIGGRPHWRVEANKLAEAARKQKRLQDQTAELNSKMRSIPITTVDELEAELLKAE